MRAMQRTGAASIQTAAEGWLRGTPEAQATGVQLSTNGFKVMVRVAPGHLPLTDSLLRALDGAVPDGLKIVADTTYFEEIEAGTTGGG